MNRSPFKFLDSYTQSDKDIFFGRESEIEEVYSRLFYSRLLLVYGPSGSGKTSLLQCGVANRFGDASWKPIFIRRKQNIIQAIHSELEKQTITPLKFEKTITEKLYSLYLDYLTPVYLIFDQFEELFIFGGAEEKQEFVSFLKDILSHQETNTQVIISIREEYLANLSEFEDELPNLFENRIRIEKMKKAHALEAIEGPCRFAGVELEEGVSEQVLERLVTQSGFIELTWLQVLMDNLYKKSREKNQQKISIRNADVENLGKMGDVLGNFLEEHLKEMPDGEQGESLLKAMITTEGTKKQLTPAEMETALRSLGHDLPQDKILQLLQHLVNVRILSDKDENGRYELKHDSLAAKIFEKLTLTEKELMEVRQFVEFAYQNYLSRKKYLNPDDLNYIVPYEGKLLLNDNQSGFIKESKKIIERKRKRKRNLVYLAGILLIFVLAISAIVGYRAQKKAELQARIEKSKNLGNRAILSLDKDPTKSYLLAEKAYKIYPTFESVKALINSYKDNAFLEKYYNSTCVVSSLKKYILLTGVDTNLIRLHDYSGRIISTLDIPNNNKFYGINVKYSFSEGDKYICAQSYSDSTITIWNIRGEIIYFIENIKKDSKITFIEEDWFVYANSEKYVKYDLNNNKAPYIEESIPDSVLSLSIKGQLLVWINLNKEVNVLDMLKKITLVKQSIPAEVKGEIKITISKNLNYILIRDYPLTNNCYFVFDIGKDFLKTCFVSNKSEYINVEFLQQIIVKEEYYIEQTDEWHINFYNLITYEKLFSYTKSKSCDGFNYKVLAENCLLFSQCDTTTELIYFNDGSISKLKGYYEDFCEISNRILTREPISEDLNVYRIYYINGKLLYSFSSESDNPYFCLAGEYILFEEKDMFLSLFDKQGKFMRRLLNIEDNWYITDVAPFSLFQSTNYCCFITDNLVSDSIFPEFTIKGDPKKIKYSPDEKYLVATTDSLIYLYNRNDKTLITKIIDRTILKGVTDAIKFSGSGSYLAINYFSSHDSISRNHIQVLKLPSFETIYLTDASGWTGIEFVEKPDTFFVTYNKNIINYFDYQAKQFDYWKIDSLSKNYGDYDLSYDDWIDSQYPFFMGICFGDSSIGFYDVSKKKSIKYYWSMYFQGGKIDISSLQMALNDKGFAIGDPGKKSITVYSLEHFQFTNRKNFPIKGESLDRMHLLNQDLIYSSNNGRYIYTEKGETWGYYMIPPSYTEIIDYNNNIYKTSFSSQEFCLIISDYSKNYEWLVYVDGLITNNEGEEVIRLSSELVSRLSTSGNYISYFDSKTSKIKTIILNPDVIIQQVKNLNLLDSSVLNIEDL